ncbi:MAG: hypothetical protein ACSLFI_00750 [Solirubrobacterales bacterium]
MSLNSYGLTRSMRILTAVILGAALLAGAFMISSNNDAKAEPATRAKKTKVLGAIGKFPNALCPSNCEALAIVSGFQSEINGVSNPYRVPYNGFVTKWKIGLGKVNKEQRDFFAENFGRKPKAGISILKPVTVKGKRRYKLMKRSPVEGLNKYMGKVSSISLKNPIPVKKGWFVALTVPTWAPALATFETRNMNPDPDWSWRASRDRMKVSSTKTTCDLPINMNNSEPQTEPGSKRQYGCRFEGAQMLYRVKVTNQL